MFTNMLELRTQSWFQQNKYAQVFVTKYGWTRCYPMRTKGDAHKGLSLLAQQDGVPLMIMSDNAKEEILGEFRRKAREMGT